MVGQWNQQTPESPPGMAQSRQPLGASDGAFFLIVRRFARPLLIGLAALLSGFLLGLLLGHVIVPLVIECCFADLAASR
jgi:hypothetical protein